MIRNILFLLYNLWLVDESLMEFFYTLSFRCLLEVRNFSQPYNKIKKKGKKVINKEIIQDWSSSFGCAFFHFTFCWLLIVAAKTLFISLLITFFILTSYCSVINQSTNYLPNCLFFLFLKPLLANGFVSQLLDFLMDTWIRLSAIAHRPSNNS